MVSIENVTTPQARFKIVCDECGSLTIKLSNPAAPADSLIECGRCNAVRGTMAGLHELARKSTDEFEF